MDYPPPILPRKGGRDELSGIEARYYVGPIVGYKFLIGPVDFLKGELGLDYVKEDYTNNTSSDFLRGRAFGEYEHRFSGVNKFVQSVEYLHNFKDSEKYLVNAVTGIVTILSSNLSLKTGYEVHYVNTPVPSTLKRTGTVFSASLIVNF